MTPNHQQFMEMPLEEASLADTEGNIPVGCVIVRDGEVITGGHNETTSTPRPHGPRRDCGPAQGPPGPGRPRPFGVYPLHHLGAVPYVLWCHHGG